MAGLMEEGGLMEKAWDEATCATFHCIRFTGSAVAEADFGDAATDSLSFPNAGTIR
jgi:hypothetical protein